MKEEQTEALERVQVIISIMQKLYGDTDLLTNFKQEEHGHLLEEYMKYSDQLPRDLRDI